jgi:hypothetical protein
VVSAPPRVKFSVRYPAGDGKWRYQPILIYSPDGGVFVPMKDPPPVGDVITLWDGYLHSRGLPQPEGGPSFRVVDRGWSLVSYGSLVWPYGQDEAREGPMLDIIVEPAGGGVYRDEAPICDEPTCEAVWVNGAWWTPPGAAEPDPHEHRPYEDRGSL